MSIIILTVPEGFDDTYEGFDRLDILQFIPRGIRKGFIGSGHDQEIMVDCLVRASFENGASRLKVLPWDMIDMLIEDGIFVEQKRKKG